jgi:ribose transport system ATP-binding protein
MHVIRRKEGKVATQDRAPFLEMRGITKEFPGVMALKGVSFQIDQGTIHAIVGENGAGKSTLMKILGGIYAPTSGKLLLNGRELRFSKVLDAIHEGIFLIAQELNIAMDLKVYENIFIGGELNRHGLVDRGAMMQRARELLESLGSDIDVNDVARHLSVAGMQLVEISRALRFNPNILIMDEPTASLSEKETTNMFKVMRSLKSRGITIIFISHRLPEVVQIADTVTVLRDGSYVGTLPHEEIRESTMVSMMVGRTLTDYYHHKVKEDLPDEYNLVVRHMGDNRKVFDVSFGARKGELLVFAGLVGAGRTELFNLIFGITRKESGEVTLNGKRLEISCPGDAIRQKISYVPEDRKDEGLFLGQSVEANIVINVLKDPRLSRYGFLNMKNIRKVASDAVASRRIKTPDVDREVESLSGGNQQKVLLARWLESRPDILILDEPTKGIDVGAKSEIYEMMGELATQGVTCIMISSDLPEVIGVAQRILVMHEGRIVTELTDKADFNQELIMSYATGVKASDYLF